MVEELADVMDLRSEILDQAVEGSVAHLSAFLEMQEGDGGAWRMPLSALVSHSRQVCGLLRNVVPSVDQATRMQLALGTAVRFQERSYSDMS